MIVSTLNALPYLIAKNIVNERFLGTNVNVKELYNSSVNKIIVIDNGINSYVLKQFLLHQKYVDSTLSNEIAGFEKFGEGQVNVDFYNKILIFEYKGIVKSFSRYNFISDWHLKEFYDKLLPKINLLHSVTSLKRITQFKPKIIDSIHFEFIVNSFSTQNFYNKSILTKFFEIEKLIKKIEIGWTFDNLIHGDFKIENVIDVNNELFLIDFESIAYGDKCWDFANLYYSTNRHFIPPSDTKPESFVFEDNNYLISKYLQSINNGKEEEAKKICVYALLIHIQNFLIATKSKLWDDEKIFKEYRKIILKWKWFENYEDSNYSYLNQIT